MATHETLLGTLLEGRPLVDKRNSRVTLLIIRGRLMIAMDGEAAIPVSELDLDEWDAQPKTVRINGVDVPATRRSKPELGQEYFTPTVNTASGYRDYIWRDSAADNRRLGLGIVHDQPEHAAQHAKAFLSFTCAPVQDGR